MKLGLRAAIKLGQVKKLNQERAKARTKKLT